MLPVSGVDPGLMRGGSFTPLSLGAALVEWWDARTPKYLTLGAGNAISNVAGRKSAYALTQSTANLQAIYDKGLIKFDAATSNPDYFTLTLTSPVAQGQMYFVTPLGWFKTGVANWTAATHTVNAPDVSQIVFIDASVITANQRTALEKYLGSTQLFFCVKTVDTTFYNRLQNSTIVNYNIGCVGNNGAIYNFASSQTGQTVDVGAQGLTAPVNMSFPIGIASDTNLYRFYLGDNGLNGVIPSFENNIGMHEISINGNTFSGPIPSLVANTALTQVNLNGNRLTGSITSLAANTILILFYCNGNRLTGSIPSLAANTLLQYFTCDDNQLTNYAGGGVSNTLSTFSASTNQLPAAAINAILADFVAAGRSGGTLTLGGAGNAAPTGQGLTDKATLSGAGWTVTTN